MKDTDLAWTAGIIDGEGCITILRQSPRLRQVNVSYRLYVKVSMNHEPTILRLQSLFGGSIHLRTRDNAPEGILWNKTWEWWIGARQAEAMLKLIRPYCLTKAAELELALQFAALPRFRGGNFRSPSAPEEVALREDFFHRMQDLKPASVAARTNKAFREANRG